MVSTFYFISFATCLMLGSFVLAKSTQRIQSVIFLFYCFSIALMSLIFREMSNAIRYEEALFWDRLTVVWPFIIAFLAHFIIAIGSFSKRSVLSKLGTLIFIYGPPLAYIPLKLTIIGKEIFEFPWGWGCKVDLSNPITLSICLWAITVIIILMIVLVKRIFKSRTSQRTGAIVVLIGTSLPVLLSLVEYIIFPAIFAKYPYTTSLGFIIGALFLSYGILNQKIFSFTVCHVAEDIVKTMREGLFLIDNSGVIRYCNSAAIEIVGKNHTDLNGMDFRLLFANENTFDDLWSIVIQNKMFTGETKIKNGDDAEIIISIGASLLHSSNNVSEGVVITIRDISEQKINERALSFAMYAVDNMSAIAIWMDETGRFKYVNDAAVKLLGYNKAQLLEMSMNDIDRNSNNGEWKTLWADLLTHGKVLFETHLTTLSGVKVPVEVSANYVEFDGKKYNCTFMLDITKRKKSEEELRLSEQKFRAQYRYLPIPTFTWVYNNANDFVLIDYNLAGEKLTSGAVGRLIGTKASVFFQDYIDVSQDMLMCYRQKKSMQKDIHYKFRVIEAEKDLRFTYAYINSELLLVHAEDVTDRKKMEESLRNSQRLEALGVVAGGIAHDFNNLLGGIFGYMDMASDALKNTNYGQVGFCLEKSLSAYERAKSLTLQLLTFAKGGEPIKRNTDVGLLIKECTEFALSGSNVSCSLAIDSDIFNCEVDRNQIAQVIDNLVINAKQAMPNGGIIIINAKNCYLDHTNKHNLVQGNYVKVQIADDGPGIPKENIDKIFDPFFSTKKHGSGLGLATAYSIIKKHGGLIFVEENRSKGASFCFYLPASSLSNDAALLETDEIIQNRSGKILVMDDEEFMSDLVMNILNPLGYTTEFATNADIALQKFKNAALAQNPFDIVILDLTIPGGIGGKEVVKELKSIFVGVQCIASSGYSDDPVMSDPHYYGFDAVLAKPFRQSDLVQVIDAAARISTVK